jgi:hypothetical protein
MIYANTRCGGFYLLVLAVISQSFLAIFRFLREKTYQIFTKDLFPLRGRIFGGIGNGEAGIVCEQRSCLS